MKSKIFTLLALLVLSSAIYAQNKGNTIEDQFTDVVDKSNNYQEFKVIKKSKIYGLRKNILDSIAALELKVETANTEIDRQKNEINTLTQDLSTTRQNLTTSIEKEDGIELFGVLTKKSIYNAIMWATILGLVLLLGFLFYKFKNSHSVTKAAKSKLAETESEFEAHRQKTLENEQVLRRKLQDEINKNRNVQ